MADGDFNFGDPNFFGDTPSFPNEVTIPSDSSSFGDPNFFGNLGSIAFGNNPVPSSGVLGQPPQANDWLSRLVASFGGGQPAQGTAQPGQGQQPGLLSQVLGTGLPAIGAGAGLIGILQQLAGGRPVSTTQVKRNVQESPQQAQLTGQTLSALQGLQGLAQNAELQQAVSRLASGQLPISPDLVKQVTSAFGATAGNLAQGSIENARQRGFSGGMDLLGGAGSPQYSQSLAQLQSDVSQALVNLALGLPQTASNIQSQQIQNAMVPIQGQLGLLGQLQQFAGMQANPVTKTFAPQPTLLSALQPISQLSQGLGQLGATRSQLAPQPQQNLSGAPNQLS